MHVDMYGTQSRKYQAGTLPKCFVSCKFQHYRRLSTNLSLEIFLRSNLNPRKMKNFPGCFSFVPWQAHGKDPTKKTRIHVTACESKASVMHTGASCQPHRFAKQLLVCQFYLLQNIQMTTKFKVTSR